jgi:hypothetical protein
MQTKLLPLDVDLPNPTFCIVMLHQIFQNWITSFACLIRIRNILLDVG